ncbi:retrotransposon protein, putative, ty1-copia subclass [Tanacetum coccineum]
MKSYLDTSECLGYAMSNELDVSLILNSLNKDYDQSVRNYNMHSMGKMLAELHAMLKLMRKGLRESRQLKHGALSLYMGNGMRAPVEAIRSFDLIHPNGLIIVLDNCHFTPTVTRGLISISCLVKNGYIHTFTNYGISVSKDNVFYFNAIPRDGIYEIDMHNLNPNVSSSYNVSNKRAKHRLDSYYLWHCHLGHINKKRMDMLQHDGLLQPTHDESHEKCKSCISKKIARKPFPHQVERAKDLLGLIHTDVCGPFECVSERCKLIITFTNDFSRYGFVYLMKHKHEVFETFKVFQNEVENQLGKKIKAIRSDRGGEYPSHEFVNHMKSFSIEYALETVARILNMVPTKKVDRTPYEIWHGKAPKLSYLRVWGYEALVKRDTPEKIDSRSIKCIFVGYLKETMGYYFYFPLENKIFVSRNAEFFENSFMVQEASGSHRLLKMSGSDKGLELIQEEDTQPSKNTSEDTMRYGYYVDIEEHELGDLNKTPNYKAALADLEADKWLEAMNMEMQSMKDNQVLYLVDLPSNARLVAKGFTQTYGVDYGETFSPVADIRAITILLAIAAFYD